MACWDDLTCGIGRNRKEHAGNRHKVHAEGVEEDAGVSSDRDLWRKSDGF